MDNPKLIIPLPTNVSNEALAEIQIVLHDMVDAFETHYDKQLREYYQEKDSFDDRLSF